MKDSADAGLRADHVDLKIKNSDFLNNANSAIVTEMNADGTIDNSTFRDNKNTALFNKDSRVTVNNSVFQNNPVKTAARSIRIA